MYKVTHKNGMREILKNKTEMNAAMTITTKQWGAIESGKPVVIKTFLGEVTVTKITKKK